MKLEHSLRPLFRTLTESGSRLGLTVIITFIVLSSPMLIYTNPILVSAKSNSIDTSSQHSTFSLKDPTLPMSPTNVSPLDSEFTTQAFGSVSARPTNNIVNTNSFYDIVFVTSTSGAIKRIQVTFPEGTTIPTSASFNEAEGIGPGTVSKSGQTLTYTVNSAVNVPAGTKIRLEFANINNPLSSSSNYKVTVTTRNAANAIIDGPTQSTAYTMKQIGKNAIANEAITTQKLVDDAVIPNTIRREGLLATVAAGVSASSAAFCEAGEHVTGGGFEIDLDGRGKMILWHSDFDENDNAWSIGMHNTDSVSHTFTPFVVCLQPFP